MWNALHRVEQFSALDPEGVRVHIPDSELRLRFRADPAGPVRISVEERDGTTVSACSTWIVDEPASEALSELAESMQLTGDYSPDVLVNATIFERLAATLEGVLETRIDSRHGTLPGPSGGAGPPMGTDPLRRRASHRARAARTEEDAPARQASGGCSARERRRRGRPRGGNDARDREEVPQRRSATGREQRLSQ